MKGENDHFIAREKHMCFDNGTYANQQYKVGYGI